MEKEEKFDIKNTENIICPFCGYENTDWFELAADSDGDIELVSCPKCCKEFEYETHITFSFTSHLPEELNPSKINTKI